MTLDVVNASNKKVGALDLRDEVFGNRVRTDLIWEAVRHEQAEARRGTHATKTRGEVRGGGAKPWRQKGTGRARHGSSREPQWKGGGISFGPKPRDHSQSVPKKMRAAALRSALSARAKDGKVIVVDGLSFETPKTKEAVAALKAWGVEGKVLLVLTLEDRNVAYAFRNLTNVHVLAEQQLNVYDILNADHLIFGRGAVEALQARLAKSKKTEGAES
jgi:large subunit ribosomal protein L4